MSIRRYCPLCVEWIGRPDGPDWGREDLGFHAVTVDGAEVPAHQIGDVHPECARSVTP